MELETRQDGIELIKFINQLVQSRANNAKEQKHVACAAAEDEAESAANLWKTSRARRRSTAAVRPSRGRCGTYSTSPPGSTPTRSPGSTLPKAMGGLSGDSPADSTETDEGEETAEEAQRRQQWIEYGTDHEPQPWPGPDPNPNPEP